MRVRRPIAGALLGLALLVAAPTGAMANTSTYVYGTCSTGYSCIYSTIRTHNDNGYIDLYLTTNPRDGITVWLVGPISRSQISDQTLEWKIGAYGVQYWRIGGSPWITPRSFRLGASTYYGCYASCFLEGWGGYLSY
jgi:hypothetical protein